MTTPLQLSKGSCANHQVDGSCLGCWLETDGRISRCTPRPCCRLAESPPTRCEYFEVCVLPGQPEVVSAYRRAVNLSVANVRKCGCGSPLAKRKRCCATCAAKRRRESYRDHKRKIRAALSTVSVRNTVKTLGKTRGFSSLSQNTVEGSHHPQTGGLTVALTQCEGGQL